MNDPQRPLAFQPDNMNVGQPFEMALKWLKRGLKITRKGWNGKGMYCYLIPESDSIVESMNEQTRPLLPWLGEGYEIRCAARIDMRYANGKFGVWTSTIEDVLATDWELLQ